MSEIKNAEIYLFNYPYYYLNSLKYIKLYITLLLNPKLLPKIALCLKNCLFKEKIFRYLNFICELRTLCFLLFEELKMVLSGKQKLIIYCVLFHLVHYVNHNFYSAYSSIRNLGVDKIGILFEHT